MATLSVRIDSSRPIFIEVDADGFGATFAAMASDEQVAVFRAITEHMRPHRLQWDHISIELEKAENREVREELLGSLFPRHYSADHDLREALEALRKIVTEDDTGPTIYEPYQVGPYTVSQAVSGSQGKFAAIARAAIAKAEAQS